MGIFVGLPILFSLLYTLGYTGGLNATVASTAQHQVVATHGLTLAGYRQLFNQPGFLADLWVTLWVSGMTTAIVVLAAWAVALKVRFSSGILNRILSTLYVLPMFIPVVIASFALVTFFEDNGKLAALLRFMGLPHTGLPGFTSSAVVLGLVWTNIPFAVILITSGLQGVQDSLVDAARDVGASWLRILCGVLVPLNKLPTIIVFTFTAVAALGSFTIPFVMGPNAPQMLGYAMANYFENYGSPQQSEMMAVLVFVLALGLAVMYARANRTEVRRMTRAGERKLR